MFSTDSVIVFTPGSPPPDPPEASAVITSPTRDQHLAGGSVVKFAGRATHQGGADFPAAALDWTVELHDASGTATVVQTGGIGGSFVIPRDSSLTADAAYEITLRVTGSDNRTVEVSQTVHPQVVHVKLSTARTHSSTASRSILAPRLRSPSSRTRRTSCASAAAANGATPPTSSNLRARAAPARSRGWARFPRVRCSR
jgi:hypothetical protein